MERGDLIKDQIEQLGRVLAKMFAGFFKLKAEGKVALGIETSNRVLKNELDMDVNLLLDMNAKEVFDFFVSRNVTFEHMEKMIDYFTEIGEQVMKTNTVKASRIFDRNLGLYEFLNSNSDTISFMRIEKIDKIHQLQAELNKGNDEKRTYPDQ